MMYLAPFKVRPMAEMPEGGVTRMLDEKMAGLSCFNSANAWETAAALSGAALKSGQPVEALLEARRKLNPTQRFGTADEFGATCAFLCSAHAGYITGQNILMDGGAYPGTF